MCVCLCTCAASNGQFPCGKNRKTQALAMNQYCQSCKQRPLAVTVGTTKKGSGRDWLPKVAKESTYQYDNNKLIHLVNLEVSSPGSQSSEEGAPQCLGLACGVK